MSTKNWSLNTRLLHLGLVATVSAQLLISLVMVAPDHKGPFLAKLAFDAHQAIGLTALTIVIAHWLWSAFSHVDGGLQHLFPWRKPARQEVAKDIKSLMGGKFPAASQKGGLAGLIHGLGLLAVTGTAITGGALFILFPESGEPGALAEAFADTHEWIASFVWAYWIGHGGIALLHHYKGHNVVRNMFTLDTAPTLSNHTQRPTRLPEPRLDRH